MEMLVKSNLARHYFKIGVIFVPKQVTIVLKKNPHGSAVKTIVCSRSAFVY